MRSPTSGNKRTMTSRRLDRSDARSIDAGEPQRLGEGGHGCDAGDGRVGLDTRAGLGEERWDFPIMTLSRAWSPGKHEN